MAPVPGTIFLSDVQFSQYLGEPARARRGAGISLGAAHSLYRVDHPAVLVLRLALRAVGLHLPDARRTRSARKTLGSDPDFFSRVLSCVPASVRVRKASRQRVGGRSIRGFAPFRS